MATSILLKFLTLKWNISRTIWRIAVGDGSLFCIFHALSFELNFFSDRRLPLSSASNLETLLKNVLLCGLMTAFARFPKYWVSLISWTCMPFNSCREWTRRRATFQRAKITHRWSMIVSTFYLIHPGLAALMSKERTFVNLTRYIIWPLNLKGPFTRDRVGCNQGQLTHCGKKQVLFTRARVASVDYHLR